MPHIQRRRKCRRIRRARNFLEGRQYVALRGFAEQRFRARFVLAQVSSTKNKLLGIESKLAVEPRLTMLYDVYAVPLARAFLGDVLAVEDRYNSRCRSDAALSEIRLKLVTGDVAGPRRAKNLSLVRVDVADSGRRPARRRQNRRSCYCVPAIWRSLWKPTLLSAALSRSVLSFKKAFSIR